YGSSATCTPTPGSGYSAVPVSATLGGLAQNTGDHFPGVATNASGTSYGADLELTTANPPGYGPCLKVTTGPRQYATGTCTTFGTKGNYEWYAAFASSKPLAKAHFTTLLKEKTEVKLQTTGGQLIACKGQSGGGDYTGNKTIGNVHVTFTGCRLGESPSC